MHTAKAPIAPPKNIPESIPVQNIKTIPFFKNSSYYIMPRKIRNLALLTKGKGFDIILIGEVFYEKGLSKGAG